MKSSDIMENSRECLKAMADDTRFEIVSLLIRQDLCAGAIARRLEISEAAVSQHIKLLRECGIIVGVKKGYFMHYSVRREKLVEMSKCLIDLSDEVRNPCDPRTEGCSAKRRIQCPVDKCCTGVECCGDCSKCPCLASQTS